VKGDLLETCHIREVLAAVATITGERRP